mmetsp:Transcript_11167/g.31488  ORF Transcript_11167/g.31488 Transcript_11167/m.31488 type:complete len:221 (+) Transcript_11167:493-1155(+)
MTSVCSSLRARRVRLEKNCSRPRRLMVLRRARTSAATWSGSLDRRLMILRSALAWAWMADRSALDSHARWRSASSGRSNFLTRTSGLKRTRCRLWTMDSEPEAEAEAEPEAEKDRLLVDDVATEDDVVVLVVLLVFFMDERRRGAAAAAAEALPASRLAVEFLWVVGKAMWAGGSSAEEEEEEPSSSRRRVGDWRRLCSMLSRRRAADGRVSVASPCCCC